MPFSRSMNKLLALLPALAWGLPLLWLLPPTEVMMLASAVLLHEGGHLFGFCLLGEPMPQPLAVLAGLTLTPRVPLSYRRELLIALLGPLANLAVAIPLLTVGGATSPTAMLGAVHLFTALSNLLPLPGTDGDRALFDLLALSLPLGAAEGVRHGVRLFAFLFLLFLGLWLLLSPGGGAAILLLSMLILRAIPPRGAA